MLDGLLPLATYCLLMTGTPGPNNVMLATSGANFGYRRTLPHLLGVSLGVFLLTVLVCLGLGAVFMQVPDLQRLLRYVGAIYLVYLAWTLAGAGMAQSRGRGRPLTFVEAAAFQLMNPKSWMKAITIATLYKPAGMAPLMAAFLVSLVGLAISLPLISVWTLFGVAIGRYLHSPGRLRVFNIAMALSLLALAVSAALQP